MQIASKIDIFAIVLSFLQKKQWHLHCCLMLVMQLCFLMIFHDGFKDALLIFQYACTQNKSSDWEMQPVNYLSLSVNYWFPLLQTSSSNGMSMMSECSEAKEGWLFQQLAWMSHPHCFNSVAYYFLWMHTPIPSVNGSLGRVFLSLKLHMVTAFFSLSLSYYQ